MASPALCADDVFVEVSRSGRSFNVRAAASLNSPVSVAWAVLTDYDNLPRFIPGLTRSVAGLRAGNRVRVEQSGEARFFLFAYPIEVQLDVVETPRQSIRSVGVGGNLKRLQGLYELEQNAGYVRLSYRGELEPDFALPRLIGTLAVRTMVDEQFGAMVAEIERRAAGGR